MIAAFPMYDQPPLQAANDALWAAIRDALPFEAPEALTRHDDLMAIWTDPELLLAHTCGLVMARPLRGRVHYVATPDFGIPGCPPGHYASAMVHRTGEAPAPGARLAFNDPDSQSGWAAAQGHGFTPAVETGAHAVSLAAVAEGRADVAFVDRHTLRIIGLPGGLAVGATTKPTPGTPLITARAEWVAPLRAALPVAFAALPEAHRATLGLTGFEVLDIAQYHAVPQPPYPPRAA
ncbi:MAG: PhnD/SsuA/transferrin family substrate-binding protein [Pseudomonadota bacterium]